MIKTQADYGSGIARPKIEEKDSFELKGQFLKELRDNTFSSSDHEDANEHIEKVLEIVDLFHIPNITQDQVMLRAFLMSLTGAMSRWLRNKPSGSITTWEDLKTKFLSKCCPPARTVKKMEEINNFQQEPDETFYQAWERFKELLMKCPQHYLTKMHEDVNNVKDPTKPKIAHSKKKVKPSKKLTTLNLVDLSKEGDIEQRLRDSTRGTMQTLQIRASTNDAIQNQGASIKTLEIQIGQMSKVLQERGFGSLPSSIEANPRDHVKSISTTVEADTNPLHRMGSSQYAISTSQNSKLIYETRQTTIPFPSRLNDYYCEEKKGSYGPKFLETLI
ncbi:hypothetical protein Tco_1448086 [Tanacetum coccineum]